MIHQSRERQARLDVVRRRRFERDVAGSIQESGCEEYAEMCEGARYRIKFRFRRKNPQEISSEIKVNQRIKQFANASVQTSVDHGVLCGTL